MNDDHGDGSTTGRVVTALAPVAGHGAAHGDILCGARKRQGEGYCTQAAGWGTDHPGFGRCKLHGGSTANHGAAADRQRIDTEARRLVALHDSKPVTNPIEALLDLAGQQVVLVDALKGLVAQLETVAYEGRTGEQVKGELRVYLEAAARAESILTSIVRLGLEERLVRLNEAQSASVARVIERVLGRAGLDASAVDVRAWVATELDSEARP